MSRLGRKALYVFFRRAVLGGMFAIGRGGARQTRRWRLRLSVDGGPPAWRPAGAGRGLGPRVSCRRCTPSRAPPHRGRCRWLLAPVVPSRQDQRGAVARASQGRTGPSPPSRRPRPARWPPPLDGPCSRGRGGGDSVCTAAPVPAPCAPGAAWGAWRAGVGEGDAPWPAPERPRRLHAMPGG
jgi:hypothetical protein